MSKARHRRNEEREEHARGGEVAYAGGNSNVEREAEEKKRGGKVKKKGRHHGRHHEVEGHRGRHRLDRPGRKRGGAVGADSHPLTTAAKVTPAEGRKGTASGDEE